MEREKQNGDAAGRAGDVLISAVVPMYNESANVDALIERTSKVLSGITSEWEIICVDDGSGDDTPQRLFSWHQREQRVHVIRLSRNFGKEAALSAGIDNAFGQVVIPLDADLQDPPELIPDMMERWRAGAKVVLATRRSRQGEGVMKRLTAWLFYRLIARMSNTPIPPNTGDFRLMDQQVVEVLRLLPERTRFMKGLFTWVGFKTETIYYDRAPRLGGEPKQSWSRLWGLAKDGVFSFTTVPLKLASYLGAFISIIAFGYAFWLLLRTVILGVDVPGYASIMAGVLFMGGLNLVGIGILGEYIGRIYRESKQRPLYVIESENGREVHYSHKIDS